MRTEPFARRSFHQSLNKKQRLTSLCAGQSVIYSDYNASGSGRFVNLPYVRWATEIRFWRKTITGIE